MLKRDKPSEYFLGAILRGYDAELQAGRVPTVGGIWNQICMECIKRPGAFQTMFQWDTSKAKNGTNRATTHWTALFSNLFALMVFSLC